MSEETVDEPALEEDPPFALSHEEKDIIIQQQSEEIFELKTRLHNLSTERDALLCEVSRLKFELEMAGLKRLSDDRPGGGDEGHMGHRGASYHIHNKGHPHVNLLHQSPNQKFERSCGVATHSPHAVVHNSHSSHVVLQGGVHCIPGTRSTSALLKKPPSRTNGDVLKRGRIQAGYELSQDLLDKQIELLERKYGGGERARAAALVIQRAFRRYTLLKKFDAITAMAKAERRLSRRLQENIEGNGNSEKEKDEKNARDPGRAPPLRSLSLRERRQLADANGPLLRSQSGCSEMPPHHIEYYTPTGLQPCMHHSPKVAGQCRLEGSHHYYYSPHEIFADANHPITHSPYCSYSGRNPPSPYCVWMWSQDGSNNSNPLPPVPPQNISNISCPGGAHPSPPRPNSAGSQKKVPPEVPKRTSSISLRGTPEPQRMLSKTSEHGSLSSVQSSGSDSSLTQQQERVEGESGRNRGSPIWKRKAEGFKKMNSPDHSSSDISLESRKELSSMHTNAYQQVHDHSVSDSQHTLYKTSEAVRKRQYRVGLNLFNKKPERGVAYLIKRGYLTNSPQAVANFLITRKGLSRQMIGEYLGNLQCPFNMEVLHYFSSELDLSGMHIDVALRKFQTYFRMPGEAQKIERLMEVFSQRYCACNRDVVATLRSPDTIFVLAFAIIMLNTDLHTPNIKPERRMKLDDFIKNLRGIDDCGDIDRDMLVGIYERVKDSEFKPGNDHVTQVMKVQSSIVGKKPNLALPHRRLVCYCRLYEIPDIYKKERPGVHQREVFLFNDLLVITKILSKKKNSVTYTFRESFSLCGMVVSTFEMPHYPFGIRLSQRVDNKVLITLNARNEHDRSKFADDLRESISEMDEMENLRIEQELERQKTGRARGTPAENRDSGVADVEVTSLQTQPEEGKVGPTVETQLKRSALSNSLLDIHEQCEKPQQRRGSVGSLDSGMSISFSATSASTVSRDSSPQNLQNSHPGGKPLPKTVPHQQSFLGGFFAKRERKTSRAGQDELNTGSCASAAPRTTEV